MRRVKRSMKEKDIRPVLYKVNGKSIRGDFVLGDIQKDRKHRIWVDRLSVKEEIEVKNRLVRELEKELRREGSL